MLPSGAETIKASNEVATVPEHKQRSWCLLSVGAVATVAAGFIGGYFMADKQATDQKLTGHIVALIQADGFDGAEFKSGGVYADYPVLNLQLGECVLPASVMIERDQNGAIDIHDYFIHADSKKDTYISSVGSTEHEDMSGVVQDAQGTIERYQSQNPCDIVQPGL